jgi:hypothetical protein
MVRESEADGRPLVNDFALPPYANCDDHAQSKKRTQRARCIERPSNPKIELPAFETVLRIQGLLKLRKFSGANRWVKPNLPRTAAFRWLTFSPIKSFKLESTCNAGDGSPYQSNLIAGGLKPTAKIEWRLDEIKKG